MEHTTETATVEDARSFGRTSAVIAVALIATLMAGLMWFSPVGVADAQEDGSEDAPPTQEERQAEREERRAEFLADVAAELGVTPEEITEAVQTVAIARVEAKLEAGEISEERAARIIERIESGEGFRFGFGHRGHGPGGRGGPGPDAGAQSDADLDA